MPYLGRAFANRLRGEQWKPEARKLAQSLLVNLIAGSFLWVVLSPAHLHVSFGKLLREHPWLAAAAPAGVFASWLAWRRIRSQVSLLSHLILRLPLRSGLFPNHERSRFLRESIPASGLRGSPIRVLAPERASGVRQARF